MKNETFLQSVKCAFRGLFYALKTEKNYKYYTGIALTFLILNILFGVKFLGYITWGITTLGVFSAECINTAIEHFIDMIDKEIKDEIRLIKDIAAAAVLVWGFAFFICEFVMLGRALL